MQYGSPIRLYFWSHFHIEYEMWSMIQFQLPILKINFHLFLKGNVTIICKHASMVDTYFVVITLTSSHPTY